MFEFLDFQYLIRKVLCSKVVTTAAPYIWKLGLTSKLGFRTGVACNRLRSHGVRDPIFLVNATSGLCSGASLLTLGSAKVLKYTNVPYASESLFVVSATLSIISDSLDDAITWHSPFI